MGKDPAFLFYPNDWMGGTLGMTFEEKGAYMELLVLQFNRGHMTTRMIGQTVGQLWLNLEAKFIKDDKGLWYNKRLEEEQNKRKSFVFSRNNNKKGINQYTKKRGHMTTHMTGHMEDEDENENRNKDVNLIKNKIDFPDNLNSSQFINIWNKWEKYRKEKKSSLTKSTKESQLKKLSKYGETIAITTIEESIMQGWTGLFPQKQQSQPKEGF